MGKREELLEQSAFIVAQIMANVEARGEMSVDDLRWSSLTTERDCLCYELTCCIKASKGLKAEPQDSEAMGLVQRIGKLHEELVANTDAREEMSLEPPEPRVKNNCELYTIVEKLVAAIRALKRLNPTPCANGRQLPGILSGAVEQAKDTTVDCSWLEGFKAALRLYAYWKDGVQYVGSCGVTLKQALMEVDRCKWEGGG